MNARIVVLATLSLLLSACAPAGTSAPAGPSGAGATGVPMQVGQSGTYTNITPAQLAEMLKHKDFDFINVHVPYEGELEQTDEFIPYQPSGAQLVSDYPADKSAKIVLYCRSGHMSTIVAQELVQAGYTNVWNLDGGFNAWAAAGFTLLHK